MLDPNKKSPEQADKNVADLNVDNQIINSAPDDALGENDITPAELEILNSAGVKESADDDDELLAAAQLDNLDEEGEVLNEGSDYSGNDLDVPGSESDDDEEMSGGEDEENNSYSLRDQEDDVEEEL